MDLDAGTVPSCRRAPCPPRGRAPGDPGLFGPGSVSWRVHADPLMAVGGLRALLLQSLHPVVAHGFAAHSGYREQSWGRLMRTADYVALTTFGSTGQVEAVAGHVRRAHAGSPFVDPGDGSRRRIDEPELLLWVHACLVDSMLVVTRRGGLGLSDAEADATSPSRSARACCSGWTRPRRRAPRPTSPPTSPTSARGCASASRPARPWPSCSPRRSTRCSSS